MPQGWVTTARGEALNMDALKDAANLPIAKSKQTKTEVKPQTRPTARKAVNIRGHMPEAGEHVPVLTSLEEPQRIDPEEKPIVTSTTESGEAETLADVTGIKVKATKSAVERAKAREGDAEDASNEALSGILGELQEANPNAVAAAEAEEKPATRSRSRSKKTPAAKE